MDRNVDEELDKSLRQNIVRFRLVVQDLNEIKVAAVPDRSQLCAPLRPMIRQQHGGR